MTGREAAAPSPAPRHPNPGPHPLRGSPTRAGTSPPLPGPPTPPLQAGAPGLSVRTTTRRGPRSIHRGGGSPRPTFPRPSGQTGVAAKTPPQPAYLDAQRLRPEAAAQGRGDVRTRDVERFPHCSCAALRPPLLERWFPPAPASLPSALTPTSHPHHVCLPHPGCPHLPKDRPLPSPAGSPHP